jgi:zinc transport system substrate-binding protein
MRAGAVLRAVSTLALALAPVFGPGPCAAAAEPPVVYAAIPPLEFVVEETAGAFVTVRTLLPPGGSPHTYEPTPRQLADLARADLYLRVGLPFEDSVLAKVSSVMKDLPVVDCSRGIERVAMEADGSAHDHGPLDPHIWLDPVRMVVIAENAATALTALLPEHAFEIESNLAALRERLEDLDRRVTTILEPLSGRDMVVLHPAYGYLARRYGLHQVAIEVEGKSPSARQLAEIVERLRDANVPAVFVQPQFSQAAAARVADALGCQIIVLDPLARDYLGNLEGMARRIAAALGG